MLHSATLHDLIEISMIMHAVGTDSAHSDMCLSRLPSDKCMLQNQYIMIPYGEMVLVPIGLISKLVRTEMYQTYWFCRHRSMAFAMIRRSVCSFIAFSARFRSVV